MNKRRRYKAKRRRVERKSLAHMEAIFPFWKNQWLTPAYDISEVMRRVYVN